MGWNVANSLHNQRIVAVVTLAAITILNIFGVRLVALINNTGVVFEILGMVVFAFVLALFHNHQGVGVIFDTGGQSLTVSTFLVAMFMSLYVIYGFDTASTLSEETRDPRREAPKAVLASVVGASVLRAVHPRLHTPIASCIAVGVFAFIPMLQYTGAAIVAIAATGMIYLSYLICNLAVIRARRRGWPRTPAPFSLGKWGIPITAVGILWGAGMLVNFAWPRVESNPTPNQTGKLLNFHWNWLNDQPILWTVAITITLVGAIYFLLVQRTKPAHLQAPEGEVYADEGPESRSAVSPA
jgi:amino acid transporter